MTPAEEARQMFSRRSLESAPSRVEVLDLSADVDLVALFGCPAVALYIGADGTVDVKTANGLGTGWKRHEGAKAGGYLVGQFTAVRKASDVTSGTTKVNAVAP